MGKTYGSSSKVGGFLVFFVNLLYIAFVLIIHEKADFELVVDLDL